MIVIAFEMQKYIIKKNPSHPIDSWKMKINFLDIPSNMPNIEFEDNLLQLDVCDECLTPFCSSDGYVQQLLTDDYVIWKEPFTESENKGFLHLPSRALKMGPIFWPCNLYKDFLKFYKYELTSLDQICEVGISGAQAKDLWRINGSISFQPNAFDTCSLEYLELNFMNIYSGSMSDDECWEVYWNAKRSFDNAKHVKFIEIDENAERITIIFENTREYREWSFAYIQNDLVLYPIGDNLAISLIQL